MKLIGLGVFLNFFQVSKNMVTIFISDVHGCILELEKLFSKLQKFKKRRIIFLGDLIGKGPEENKVVNFVRNGAHLCIMGNHELHVLKTSLTSNKYLAARFSRENLHFIKKLPTYILCKKFLAVHAGINCITKNTNSKSAKKSTHPESEINALQAILLNNSSHTLTNIRTIDGKPWHDFYKMKTPVIYGHWGAQGTHFTTNTIGIDSGCVYGGKLSAYILEEKELIQVQAKKSYI